MGYIKRQKISNLSENMIENFKKIIENDKKLNQLKREVGNFFWDTAQKYTKDLNSEDREQMWWWKNVSVARNVWYYRDRLSTVRGPCTLPVLREAWVRGIIDDKTLVWGNGLIDWIPIRNINLLSSAIRTLEVQIATQINKKILMERILTRVREQREAVRMIHSNQLELWN